MWCFDYEYILYKKGIELPFLLCYDTFEGDEND